MKFNSLQEIFDKWPQIVHIKDTKTLNRQYFDVTNLDADSMPKVMVDKHTIVVSDRSNFKNSYLLDKLMLILDQEKEHPDPLIAEKYRNVDVAYIDDDKIKQYITCPRKEINFDNEDDVTNHLLPFIVTLNPETGSCCLFKENDLTTFDDDIIRVILIHLIDNGETYATGPDVSDDFDDVIDDEDLDSLDGIPLAELHGDDDEDEDFEDEDFEDEDFEDDDEENLPD